MITDDVDSNKGFRTIVEYCLVRLVRFHSIQKFIFGFHTYSHCSHVRRQTISDWCHVRPLYLARFGICQSAHTNTPLGCIYRSNQRQRQLIETIRKGIDYFCSKINNSINHAVVIQQISNLILIILQLLLLLLLLIIIMCVCVEGQSKYTAYSIYLKTVCLYLLIIQLCKCGIVCRTMLADVRRCTCKVQQWQAQVLCLHSKHNFVSRIVFFYNYKVWCLYSSATPLVVNNLTNTRQRKT